ncbi:MAG: acyl carrier protein [Catenulispora sp.]
MDVQTVTGVITEILTTKYDVEPDRITPDARFADLELDSLVLAEMSVILSSRLGIEVGDDELAEAGAVGAAAEALSARLIPQAATA